MKNKKTIYIIVAVSSFFVFGALALFSNTELFKGAFYKIPFKDYSIKIPQYSVRIKDNKYTKQIPKIVQRPRVLSVLVSGRNNNPDPALTQNLRDVLFNNNNSVKTFFAENSYNLLEIVGEVLNDVVFIENLQGSFNGNFWVNYNQLLDSIDQRVDLRNYDHVLFVLTDEVENCDGNSSSIGKTFYDTNDGRVNIGYAALTSACVFDQTKTIKHELGHLLGLRHTATLIPSQECPNIPLENLSNDECTVNNYGGLGIMGSTEGDLIASQRDQLTLLHNIPYNSIEESGEFNVYWWRNKPQNQYEELRILFANGYYSIELRKDLGIDVENGVTINFVPADLHFFDDGVIDNLTPETILVAPRARTLTMENNHFRDDLRDIEIDLLSLEENLARLRISRDLE